MMELLLIILLVGSVLVGAGFYAKERTRREVAELEREWMEQSRNNAWNLVTRTQEARKGYGLQVSEALRGRKHSTEPENDGRMQAIRDLVAENERLKQQLNGEA